DGRYTAHFEAADQAANRGIGPLFDVQIDTTAPTITLSVTSASVMSVSVTSSITETQPALWHLTPVTLTLSAVDALSGVHAAHYAWDRDELIYAEPIRIDVGGQHELRYWAEDVAGNRSPMAAERILLDLAPPQIALAQLGGGANTAWLGWQTSDDGSGVARVTLEVQQAEAWAPHPLSAQEELDQRTVFALAKGETLRVRMRAIDAVGRESEWVEFSLTPPQATLYLPLVRR
ncbi:MAG: hypothetical protein KDE54_25080, partial [Caldilineaceae bacterium]|nr:hypothetical protein [Caldilineaceae bacterium]MCB0140338.1 hypothetical protein [Caldilineaceae bacterium]